MDKENVKLAHETITSIVRSAIEKGNLDLEKIASLTRELKEVFLPELTTPSTEQEPVAATEPDLTTSPVDPEQEELNAVLPDDANERPRITFEQLKEGRKKDPDYCKNGAIILDPENTFTDTNIVCLEDLVGGKILKSRIKNKFKMTLEEYRKKWGLPANYKLSTESIAQQRRKNVEKRMANQQAQASIITKKTST